MLRWISRKTLNWFCTIQTPISQNLQKLKDKINQNPNNTMHSLEILTTEEMINEHFDKKLAQNFSLEDIYFYLSNQHIFAAPNNSLRYQLVSQSQIGTYAKFLISDELKNFHSEAVKKYLINIFNQTCLDLSESQFLFCLKRLVTFPEIQKQVNSDNISSYIEKLEQNSNIYEILYYLSLIKDEKIRSHLQKIGNSVSKNIELFKNNLQLANIYFSHVLEESLQIQALPEISKMRQQYIENHTSQKEQSQFFVKILPYYPQYTYYININRLDKASYQVYLEYLLQQKLQYPHFVILEHDLPQSLLEEFSSLEFQKVTKYWGYLGMFNHRQLAERIKLLFTHNLSCVRTTILYLQDQKLEDEQIWKIAEDNLRKGLKLHDKNIDLDKILSRYDLSKLISLFSESSFHQLWSGKFWNSVINFINKLFKHPELIYELQQRDQNKLFPNIIMIYKSKPFSSEMEQKLTELILITLSKNFWGLSDMYSLISRLYAHRIGGDELWFALQKNVKKLRLYDIRKLHQQEKVRRIFSSFKKMNKGSKSFWKLANDVKYLQQKQQFQPIK